MVTNICLDQLRKRKVRKEEPAVVETAEGPIDRMDTLRGRSGRRPTPSGRCGTAS